MDTVIDLKIYSDNGVAVLDKAINEISRLEKLFDRGSENSDIYKINQNKSTKVSSDTVEIISKALTISQETNGAFDITLAPVIDLWGFYGNKFNVPSNDKLKSTLSNVGYKNVQIKDDMISIPKNASVDFGGIGKGYASDKVVELLKENGIKSAIISLGGNVYAIGKKPNNSLWVIGIANPNNPAQPIGKLLISNKAVITSGNYQRYFEQDGITYHHIINPKTGKSADSSLESVTIIADSGTRADGLSTALFVMGLDKGIEFWQSSGNFDAIFIDDNGTIYVTAGIKDIFESSSDYVVIYK